MSNLGDYLSRTEALAVLGVKPKTLYRCRRCAGWMAYAMKQRLAGFMIRPRAKFGGAASPLNPHAFGAAVTA